MTDAEVQRKLDQLVRLANSLVKEAHDRYGETGMLFFESEGTFHLMDGDENGSNMDRQKHVRFMSNGYCRMGAGAW